MVTDIVSLHDFDDQGYLGKLITRSSWFTRISLSFVDGKPKLKVSFVD